MKHLGNYFERRKRLIQKTENADIKINRIFKMFLDNQFGNLSQKIPFRIRYNPRDNNIIIETGSKAVANELTLRLVALSDYFRRGSIKLSRILIR